MQLFLLTALVVALAACSHAAEPEEEVITIGVDDWPEQVQATPIPTATSFPKFGESLAVADSSTTQANPSATRRPQSPTSVGASMPSDDEVSLPPSVLQAITEELELADVVDLVKQAQDGATAPEILAQIEPEDLKAIVAKVDPADMRTMLANLDEEEARQVATLLDESGTDVAELVGNDLDSTLALLSQADASEIKSQVDAAINSAPPLISTAIVKEAETTKRTGPGLNYAAADTLVSGDVAGIFGIDSSKQWAFTLSADGNGWIPLDALRIVGELTEAPVLPANVGASFNRQNPIEASLSGSTQQAASSNSSSAASKTATTNTTATTSAAPAVEDMTVVTTVQPANSLLNMRQGPGASYGLLETLKGEVALEVLAQNKTEDWLLVKTPTDSLGWVSKGLTTATDEADDAPIVLSARPDTTIPSGQIARISGMRVATNAPVETATTSSNTQPDSQTTTSSTTETGTTESESSLPAPANLSQVATLRLNQPEVFMRLGPNTSYGYIDELTTDDEDFYVLATDDSQTWALVKRSTWEQPEIGWVALNEMQRMSGEVEAAPTVMTTWTEGNGIEVRHGPGLTYDSAGFIGNQAMLVAQGANSRGDWWLVTPVSGGSQFWISERFLADTQRVADSLPVVELPTVSQPDAKVAALRQERITPEGKIVFQTASGGDIMITNVDGSDLRTLTTGIDPVLSPDGQSVAFTRWGPESAGLWSINVNGFQERQILGFTTKAKGAAWSPDGSQIVLNYQTSSEGVRESCQNLLTRQVGRPPREARNIKTELKNGKPYLCWDLPPQDSWNLRVVDVANGEFVDKDGGLSPFRPAWDPLDANRIVFDSGIGLAALDVAANAGQAMTDINQDGSPVFSPDGQFIAVATGQGGESGSYDIYRLNRDGGGRVQLTKTPLWVTLGPKAGQAWNNVAPAWSPDGSLIAFLTDRTGDWQLWVMNADGSDQRALFSDEVNEQLDIQYDFVDERVVSWR